MVLKLKNKNKCQHKIFISEIRKREAIKLLQNTDLTENIKT